MATFTMDFNKVLEVDPTIESGILAGYPIFDEAHRHILNRKIINHYWNHEIGMESVSLFRLALTRKLDEIMPLYNQQYEISAIKFNQLQTINVNNKNTGTGNTVSDGTSTNGSTSDSKARAVGQELPQTMLSATGDYGTNAQDNVANTTATGTGAQNSTVTQDNTTNSATTGFQGNPALMLLQYRQSLVNVDMMILDELANLFMLIWSNGDDFTETAGHPTMYGYGLYAY